MTDLFDLTGKVALVTGGSRGLGREMCLAFAGRGADVIVSSRKAEACEAVAAEVEQRGRRGAAIPAHVGRWADCDRLIEEAYAAFGRVDVLVNNAGMSPRYESLTSISEELFDKVVAVNMKGAFRLGSLVGERMAAGDGGSIVNVSSVAAVMPTPVELPYAMAKAGLDALTSGLARAYAPKVRANTIMPGPFLTDISEAWPAEWLEQMTAQIPLGRAGDPDEIVGAALYLASAASGYTTGATIRIDGGLAYAAG